MENEQKALRNVKQLYGDEKVRVILSGLMEFVRCRVRAMESQAKKVRDNAGEDEVGRQAFRHLVTSAWEALDGTGRLIDCALYPRFPDNNLVPPLEINAQITFYTVRRDLHRDPAAADHALTELLWSETRDPGNPWYERLSLYYHISRFLPLNLSTDGRLPGWSDLPGQIQSIVREQPVQDVALREGVNGVVRWESGFIERCLKLIARKA